MLYLLFAVVGYLSGSIMYSYLVPRIFCHKDIRQISSDGNPGMTNVFVHCGRWLGLLCLVLDLLKAFLPVFVSLYFLDVKNLLFIAVMVAPPMGHAFPPLMKFHGGKAIATVFGVSLAVIGYTPIGLVFAGSMLFLLLVVTVKPHAMAIIIGATLMAAGGFVFYRGISFAVSGLLLAALLIFKHVKWAKVSPLDVKLFMTIPVTGRIIKSK